MNKNVLNWFILVVGLALGGMSCTSEPLDKEDVNPEDAELYTLTRVYQQVVRYDCNGIVTSDKVETVEGASASVEIEPDNKANLFTSTFQNMTTESYAKCIADNKAFRIDIAETVCNMRVQKGLNRLRYEFYYCNSIKRENDKETCEHEPFVGESGELYIRVAYEVEDRVGTLERRPSPESCQSE